MDDIKIDNSLSSIEEDNARYLWQIGHFCLIYSRSKNKWFKGEINHIYINNKTNKEWLVVKSK